MIGRARADSRCPGRAPEMRALCALCPRPTASRTGVCTPRLNGRRWRELRQTEISSVSRLAGTALPTADLVAAAAGKALAPCAAAGGLLARRARCAARAAPSASPTPRASNKSSRMRCRARPRWRPERPRGQRRCRGPRHEACQGRTSLRRRSARGASPSARAPKRPTQSATRGLRPPPAV